MLQQAGFDFTQFDAEAANLHLVVDTPQVFHQAVGALAHQIAGAVQTPAIAGKWIGHEAFGSHAGALVIALRQARSANVQLAARALGYQRKIGVENVRHPCADHAPDRHAGFALLQLLRGQAGQRHDHSFGRAIGIE